MSFLGFGDFQKPGRGIRKDEPVKNRFFLFFELYFRNFFRLAMLNLLYMVVCIPVVTFGPATTALLRITSDMVERKPVFIWHDFWKVFRENFKSSFFWGILEIFITIAMLYALWFFPANFKTGNFFIYLGAIAALIFSVIFLFMFFYTWLLSAKVSVGGLALLKNSLILSVMSIKCNLIIGAFLLAFWGLYFVTFPFGAPVLLIFPMSTLAFLISYLYFPYVYLHVIKPYYEQSGEEDPYAAKDEDDEDEYEYVYEDAEGNVMEAAPVSDPPEAAAEEPLFRDAPQLEKAGKAAPERTVKKAKTLK